MLASFVRYNKYQIDFFNKFSQILTSGNQSSQNFIIVDAVAGSGKTTAICGALDKIPQNCSTLVACFNQHVKQELESRLNKSHNNKRNVHCSTIHSLGLKILRLYDSRLHIPKKDKTNGIVFGHHTKQSLAHEIKIRSDADNATQQIKNFKRMLTLLYGTKTDFKDSKKIQSLGYKHGIKTRIFLEPSNLFVWFDNINEQLAKKKHLISFQDAVTLPVVWGIQSFIQYDCILIDEYQDLNQSYLSLLFKCLKPNGTLVFVGDTNQALYNWNGALPKFELLQQCHQHGQVYEMPLSLCYRCPSSHLQLVRRWVPHILPAPDAPKGEINYIHSNRISQHLTQDSLVISRTVAPLIPMLMYCHNHKINAHIKGLDIGNELKAIAKLLKAPDGSINSSILKSHLKELEIANSELLTDEYIDKVQAMIAICSEYLVTTINELLNFIDSCFGSDSLDGVTLSTIHKAKGMEANRVFVLDSNKLESPSRETDWKTKEEINCAIVAFTRSTYHLFLCNGELTTKPLQTVV